MEAPDELDTADFSFTKVIAIRLKQLPEGAREGAKNAIGVALHNVKNHWYALPAIYEDALTPIVYGE